MKSTEEHIFFITEALQDSFYISILFNKKRTRFGFNFSRNKLEMNKDKKTGLDSDKRLLFVIFIFVLLNTAYMFGDIKYTINFIIVYYIIYMCSEYLCKL